MCSAWTWRDRDRLTILIVMRLRIDDRPAGLLIDAFCPSHLGERLRGYKRARHPVDDIVKAVLVRLHDDFALAAVDHEIGKHQLLHAVEIPRIARNHLVVPLQFTGLRSYCQDRAHIQVVFAFGFAKIFRPRSAVTGSYVDQVRFRIVSDAVPNRSAAA